MELPTTAELYVELKRKPFAHCCIKYQAPSLISDKSIDLFYICDGIRLY